MSDFRFSVVPYDSCVDEVIAFRNANRDVVRDQRYFEWRYKYRPCQKKALIVWGMDGRGNKVAAASIIPHDFHVLDGEYPVGMLGDISVAPECRGRGVATHMLEYAQQDAAIQSLHACLVLPNDEAFRSLERAGMSTATTIARFVKVLDAGPRLEKRFGSSWPVAGFARAINIFTQFTSLDGLYARRGPYQTSEISDFSQEFDELWRELPKQGRILALRNRIYLDWRYRQHPTVHYRIIAVYSEQRLRGYIVFHLADRIAVIDDFLAVEAKAGIRVIKDFLNLVRRVGIATDIYVRFNTKSHFSMPWSRFGFVRRPDFQRVMVNVIQSEKQRSPLFDESDWFVTAGDKDV